MKRMRRAFTMTVMKRLKEYKDKVIVRKAKEDKKNATGE